MRLKISLVMLITIATIPLPTFGSGMQTEIDHLLIYVESTNCQYERNGKLHVGKDAAKHIRKKYDYYKDKIDTTEKFIELSATKSTMSGKYYMILCNGKAKITSQSWLLGELKEFRSKLSKKKNTD